MKTFRLSLLALLLALTGRVVADDPKPAQKEEPVYKGRKLSEWVQQYKTGDLVERQGAVWAYTEMGADAVPFLAEALNDQQLTNCRLWAAYALRKIGPDAKAAEPQLELALKDDVSYVRVEAAGALWAISEHKAAIPALIELLKNEDAGVRYMAAESLERIGPKAKEAVPALTEALKDPGQASFSSPTATEYKAISDEAAKALKNIDPEAAKKAGIK
jgi:HEAT repeat protein